MLISTAIGDIEEHLLERTLQFTERANEFSVTVEWTHRGGLVRRDAHVILKRIPEAAEAVVGALASRGV